jgi:hypothetical protein
MLKAVGGRPGDQLVALGLSTVNLRRLEEGNPIPVWTSELGVAGDAVLLLVYGPTAEHWRMLAGAVAAREEWARVVVLGLGPETMARLRERRSFVLDLAGHQPQLSGIKVFIFHGPTEEQMEAELGPLLADAERLGPGRWPGTDPD